MCLVDWLVGCYFNANFRMYINSVAVASMVIDKEGFTKSAVLCRWTLF
jgi:hypothetical protein